MICLDQLQKKIVNPEKIASGGFDEGMGHTADRGTVRINGAAAQDALDIHIFGCPSTDSHPSGGIDPLHQLQPAAGHPQSRRGTLRIRADLHFEIIAIPVFIDVPPEQIERIIYNTQLRDIFTDYFLPEIR